MAYTVTDGNDSLTFSVTSAPNEISSGSGSDTFTFSGNKIKNGFIVDGGTKDLLETDAEVVPMYYGLNGSGAAHKSIIKTDITDLEGISTALSTLETDNDLDTIIFQKSGDFSNLEFLHIERVNLSSGVSVTLSSDALMNAIASLDYDNEDLNPTEALELGELNPGVHFYGVAGGQQETVNIVVNYALTEHAPTVGSPVSYLQGDFQLDDASIADMFHNVTLKVDFGKKSTEASYARADGTNSLDYFIGSKGVDYATLRAGNDTYIGGSGNDVLNGGEGADSLDGGDGHDFFIISSFESGIAGSSHKSDTGTAEWVSTGAKKDVITGGNGIDTLRITAGADTKAHGTIELSDATFKGMEVIEVGSTVGAINTEIDPEDDDTNSALQMINNHFYHNAVETGTPGIGLNAGQTFDNVVIDATDVTANGLKFIGNGYTNTFIGTNKSDTFIGNGGNDTLTGGAGADFYEFGNVHTQTVKGANTTPQRYKDVATALTGKDTITDFKSGTDKIVLHDDLFSALEELGSISVGNLVLGSEAVDADDFLLFNSTTKTLSFDADGNGSGTAVEIAVLTGVSSLTAVDFIIV